MNIAVTGATSMLGRAIIKRALERGDTVTCFVRPDTDKSASIPDHHNIAVVECDISDYSAIQLEDRFDTFFHLAWGKTTGSGREDIETQINSIRGAVQAVDLAERLCCTSFIGAGSQAEYGRKEVALTEELAVSPESGYGIAKYTAGRYVALKCEAKGIRPVWLRILSLYGPGDHDASLISHVVSEFQDGRAPQLTPCEQMWDYLFVEDAAEAFFAAAESERCRGTYVLGSGTGRVMAEYVRDIQNVLGAEVEPAFGAIDYYPHQPMMLVADITAFKQDTGWMPRTEFVDGIRRTLS